ncbi:MAG: hypothetical protein AMXMBFR84_06060 [Candidatus Hydrogenedentota bacterium]
MGFIRAVASYLIFCVVLGLGGQSVMASAADASAASRGSVGIWISPISSHPARQALLQLRYPSYTSLPAELLLECDVDTKEAVDTAAVVLTVRDAAGQVQHTGRVAMSLAEGLNHCRFTWDPAALPDGDYTALVEVTGAPHPLAPSQSFEIRKLSTVQLNDLFAAVDAEIAGLKAHLARLDADAIPPYVRTNVAIAEDYMKVALEAYAGGDWRLAIDVATYIMGVSRSARVDLTFATASPERGDAELSPAVALALPEGGGLADLRKPVMLMGAAIPTIDTAASSLRILERYRLNYGSVGVNPADVSTESGRASIAAINTQAKAAGVVLTWYLIPSGDAVTTGYVDEPRSIVPETAERYRAALGTLGALLESEPAAAGVSVAHMPAFRLEGDAVRDGFVATTRAAYKDLDEVNRVWRSRYRAFEQIDMRWDRKHPAYQFDLLTYHNTLGTRYIELMQSAFRQQNDRLPLLVSVTPNAFDPDDARLGVDRDIVARMFELGGIVNLNPLLQGPYAIPYTNVLANYTLIRSLSGGNPLLNLDNRFLSESSPRGEDGYRYVHTLVWEQAMTGLSAMAAPFTSPEPDVTGLLSRPEWMHGFAIANLDLNRLAPVVRAFQSDPARVAILWSRASRLYGGGEAYLSSARDAFEGASFFGFAVRYITEMQCAGGDLSDIDVLIVPETPALPEASFQAIRQYIADGGCVIRQGRPIPYNEHGTARTEGVPHTQKTRFVRSHEWARETLALLDASFRESGLPDVPRVTDVEGYPMAGVKSRYCEVDGQRYFYVVNLRTEPVRAHITTGELEGRDLIQGEWVRLPMVIDPMQPRLIRVEAIPELETVEEDPTLLADKSPVDADGIPFAEVGPIPVEEPPAAPTPPPAHWSKGRPQS